MRHELIILPLNNLFTSNPPFGDYVEGHQALLSLKRSYLSNVKVVIIFQCLASWAFTTRWLGAGSALDVAAAVVTMESKEPLLQRHASHYESEPLHLNERGLCVSSDQSFASGRNPQRLS